MQKIIDGYLYDTNTATLLCYNNRSTSDMHNPWLGLYCSPGGQFFIHTDSKFGREISLSERDEAMSFFEDWGDPDKYEEAFGQAAKVG